MEKAVVTGATGFLGRHIVDCLCQHKVQVYAVFRSRVEKGFFPDDVVCILDDLSDETRLAESLKAAGAGHADVFYHAAWSGVAPQDKNDYECQRKNLLYSVAAVNACHALHCQKFVNVGTVAEYVHCDGLIDGHQMPTPNDIYGAMKVAVRYVTAACAQKNGLPMIHTILSSTFGEHRSDDNVISYTIKALLKGEKPSFGALDQLWNFVYIRDAAYAYYLIGCYGVAGKTYAIGTEERKPLNQYILQIRDQIDPALPLGIGEKKAEYTKVRNSCVDISELQADTGFRPQFSFEQGLQRTIAWFRGQIGEQTR